jgi:putative endonuclease
MERRPCVCLLASGWRGTLYIGVMSDLMKRVYRDRSGDLPGFTGRYGVHRLVWFEMFDDMPNAIAWEKRLKAWRPQWKIELVEAENPLWEDLAVGLGFPPTPSS